VRRSNECRKSTSVDVYGIKVFYREAGRQTARRFYCCMASPLRRTCFDYRNNSPQYSKWQAYLRERQPPMLVVWGKNDPFFTVDGAKAYRREVPKAEVHLFEGGHFRSRMPSR
jgi:pimeloyl-ACP methyl ester carboxylesterase